MTADDIKCRSWMAATRIIRSAPRFDNLPIIAMTAHAMAEDREKSLAAGMNDHITKPVNPRQLSQMLQRWLGTGTSAGQVPEVASADNTSLPLDLDKALQFADHDQEKMRNRLSHFYACYEPIPSQLEVMIQNNDHEGLCRMAHTLKSASGYIGAQRLQQAAAQLWIDKAQTEHHAAMLRQELQAVLLAISAYITVQTTPDTSANPPATYLETLNRLETLISTQDAKASVQLATLQRSMAGSPRAIELTAIRDAFEELDIPLALNKLAALRQAYTKGQGSPQ
jgi:HPt (histidine-containing phosphotransfer) domain-containing protein